MAIFKMQIQKLKEGDEVLPPVSQLHKALYILNFLNCPKQGLTPAERHWQSQEPTIRPRNFWKNVLTGTALVLSWCRVEGIFVFFLNVQNTQCRYHCSLSSLMDPLVLKMRRLSLEDSPRNRELLRLTPPPTRGQPRKWPLVRQTQDSEPSTWDQIKTLIDM
jgi:hypothetical protein